MRKIQKFAKTKRFSPHLNIWVAITKSVIFGPYFFEEDNLTVTVNNDHYIRLLEQEILPDLKRSGIRREDMYFHHDNATTHTSQRTMEFLQKKFQRKTSSASHFGHQGHQTYHHQIFISSGISNLKYTQTYCLPLKS